MTNRESLDDYVRNSLLIPPEAAQLFDANFRMRGYDRLLSIWPPPIDQINEDGIHRAAEMFKYHIIRHYAVEMTLGRLLVGPCCLEPLGQDLRPRADITRGTALWLEPAQLQEGVPDFAARLEQVARDYNFGQHE